MSSTTRFHVPSGICASTYGETGCRPACQAAYIEVALKYSMNPCRKSRSGFCGVHAPRSSVSECMLAKPANGQIGEVANVLVITSAQQRENVAALVVPCSRGRVWRRCEHGSARGERRIVEEALVRIDVRARRMIDRHQPKLIDEIDLFHRLAESHAEVAIASFELRAFNLDPLVGIGRVLRRRRNPMADDCRRRSRPR